MFQSFGIPHGCLTEQFLKFPPIVERSLHIRNEFIGNIYGESFPLSPHIQEITGVLSPFQAGLAILTDAGTPTQTQRAQSDGPKIYCIALEPLLDICRRFVFGWHVVCMPYSLRIVKHNLLSHVMAISSEFRDRN